MKITILGNNSALPAFGRHPSAQVVSVYGELLLLDCGEGTQIQMQRFGIRWRNLQHIFISHLHGDHYFGLFGLLNSMSLLGRVAPMHLYAPAPLEGLLQQIHTLANTSFSYPLHFHALPDGAGLLADTDSFTVSCFPLQHSVACHGFMIEGKTRGRKLLPGKCREYNIPTEYYESLKQGSDYVAADGNIIKNDWVTENGPFPKRYAYVTDTICLDTFIPYIKDVDALYHESTYLDADIDKAAKRLHSTAKQAAETAKMANAKMLLLGHYSSKYKELEPFKQEASVIFPNVFLTLEGMSYEI